MLLYVCFGCEKLARHCSGGHGTLYGGSPDVFGGHKTCCCFVCLLVGFFCLLLLLVFCLVLCVCVCGGSPDVLEGHKMRFRRLLDAVLGFYIIIYYLYYVT